MSKSKKNHSVQYAPDELVEKTFNKGLYVILIVMACVLIGLVFGGFYYLGSQSEGLRSTFTTSSRSNEDQTDNEEVSNKPAEDMEIVAAEVSEDEKEMVEKIETVTEPAEVLLPEEIFEAQVYTNQFYPSFKLAYDSGWNFRTQTRPSSYDSLVTRNITLTKGEAVLTLELNPVLNPDRCGYSGFGGPSKLLGEFGDGIREFSSESGGVYFGNFQGCDSGFILKTNINRNESEDYLAQTEYYEGHPEEVHFQMSVRTNITEEQRVESAEYQEIKKFLSESVFK